MKIPIFQKSPILLKFSHPSNVNLFSFTVIQSPECIFHNSLNIVWTYDLFSTLNGMLGVSLNIGLVHPWRVIGAKRRFLFVGFLDFLTRFLYQIKGVLWIWVGLLLLHLALERERQCHSVDRNTTYPFPLFSALPLFLLRDKNKGRRGGV